MFSQSSRYAFGDLREERMQEIWNDQANQTGSTGCQRARILIRLVIQFLDAAQDPLARFFPNVAVVTQYLRHGDGGDPEIARDILQPNGHVLVK